MNDQYIAAQARTLLVEGVRKALDGDYSVAAFITANGGPGPALVFVPAAEVEAVKEFITARCGEGPHRSQLVRFNNESN